MIYNLAHNGNKLITFTIDGTTYQAMNGMTWGEWVNSEYNTGGFSISNNAVIKDDNNEISVISEYEVVEGERAKVEA